jgi:hypothetical protein
MPLNGTVEVGAVGIFGGCLAELYRQWAKREMPLEEVKPANPLFYWVTTILMIIAGGFLAWCYGTDNVPPLYVVHIGATTPIIIQTAFSTGISQVQKRKKRRKK